MKRKRGERKTHFLFLTFFLLSQKKTCSTQKKAIVGPRMRDAVSFGPTILGAHSPDERVDVRTVAPFFEAVKRLMERLADEKATK
jgi:acetylornithine deacetylase/succinyl-diaminopimelate desuccinylase-like protein